MCYSTYNNFYVFHFYFFTMSLIYASVDLEFESNFNFVPKVYMYHCTNDTIYSLAQQNSVQQLCMIQAM